RLGPRGAFDGLGEAPGGGEGRRAQVEQRRLGQRALADELVGERQRARRIEQRGLGGRAEQPTEREPRRDEPRVARQRRALPLEREARLALLHEHVAEAGERLRVAGRERERGLELAARARELAALRQRDRVALAREGAARLRLGGLGEREQR